MSGTVQMRISDLATLTRNLVSATVAIVMKTAGVLSLTRKKPSTLGTWGKSCIPDAPAWSSRHAEL